MKTRILVLASCLLAFASQAQESTKELWTWRDANGVVHFSDTPGPGAKRVDLVVTGPPSGGATAAATASTAAPPPAAPVTTYNLLEIWQPENGASFFDADATVNVRIRSEPALAEGDTLRLFLDGMRVEGADNSLDYTFAESRTWHALDHGHDPRRQGRREDPQPACRLLHEAEHDHRASRRRAEPEGADAADTQGRLTGACQQAPRRRLVA